MSSSPLHTCGDGGRGAKDVRWSCRATVGVLETVSTSSLQTLAFSPKLPFLQTQNLLCHFSRYTFGRRKRKRDDTTQKTKVLLLHKSHRYKRRVCLGSKEFRLSPCRTSQKKIRSSPPCSTVYIDLPLEAKRSRRSRQDVIRRRSQGNDMMARG